MQSIGLLALELLVFLRSFLLVVTPRIILGQNQYTRHLLQYDENDHNNFKPFGVA